MFKELDKRKAAQEAELARLSKSVDFYSQRLGLVLQVRHVREAYLCATEFWRHIGLFHRLWAGCRQNAGGSLSLDYTLIDPAAPAKVGRPSAARASRYCPAADASRRGGMTCGEFS